MARLIGACPAHRISVIALRIETTNLTLTIDQTNTVSLQNTPNAWHATAFNWHKIGELYFETAVSEVLLQVKLTF